MASDDDPTPPPDREDSLAAEERQRLADALREGLEVTPRKRRVVLRKVSDHVTRTWVSAGCFGEAVQWKLKKRPRPPNKRARRRKRRQQKPDDEGVS